MVCVSKNWNPTLCALSFSFNETFRFANAAQINLAKWVLPYLQHFMFDLIVLELYEVQDTKDKTLD